MRNILGISVKTKHLGFAVLYDGELVDFRVRTFYGVWTEDKRNDILRTIRKAINRFGVTAIVVKAPKPAHCSNSILNILSDIEGIAEEGKIKLTLCTISELKKWYSKNEMGNKQTLIQAIIKKYPHHRQLTQLYEKEKNNRNAYYVKIFEAIACAEMAIRTEH
jgi:hypothetical protein